MTLLQILSDFAAHVSGARKPDTDGKRPIKFVEEKPNVWRIVYADVL